MGKPKNKPGVPRGKGKTVSGSSTRALDARDNAALSKLNTSANLNHMRSRGIDRFNITKREGIRTPLTNIVNGISWGSNGQYTTPTRVHRRRATDTYEAMAHAVERDRIKSQFGEDIGPRKPGKPASKKAPPKTRNRSEAARKAAITRKRNGGAKGAKRK